MLGTSILVVDGRPVNLKLIRLLLTHEAYRVRTAESAEDALQLISSDPPELVLTDIPLPRMNGLDLTRTLKEDPRTSAIKVVAFSASAAAEDRERALAAGCDDYIRKPIDTPTLIAKVRELLARPPLTDTLPLEAPSESHAAPGPSSPEIEAFRRRFLNRWEIPRLCRGGSRSLTIPGVRLSNWLPRIVALWKSWPPMRSAAQ